MNGKRRDAIKVLIVDDSPIVRATLTRVLEQEVDIDVVGGATDPYDARGMIIATPPNVIILDLEMPRMDGLTFLKKLMAHYPVPVIICSGITASNGRKALEAMEAGAVEVIAKPTSGGSRALRMLGQELAEKIRAAAIVAKAPPRAPAPVSAVPSTFRAAGLEASRYLIAIGASTGGTEAIKAVLMGLPADVPPIVIVQHMPGGFTKSFADRLNEYCAMTVSEAVSGDILAPGRAFIGPGGVQMRIRTSGGQRRIALGTDEPVNRHCPSVEVLFNSVAEQIGRNAVGIILTGMGADGAQGLLNMRRAGALTIAQDESSSAVYGMPKAAKEIGAVRHVASLGNIPGTMFKEIRRQGTTAAAMK